MPLLNHEPNLTFYREIALIQAQREGRAYLVLPHSDPCEAWSWAWPYCVAEEDASVYERANAVGRLTP